MNNNLVFSINRSHCSSAMTSTCQTNNKFLVTALNSLLADENDHSQALTSMKYPLNDSVYVGGILIPRSFDENKKILWDVQIVSPIDEAGDQVKRIHISVKDSSRHAPSRDDFNTQSQHLSIFQQEDMSAAVVSRLEQTGNNLTTEKFNNKNELDRLLNDFPISRGDSDGSEDHFHIGQSKSIQSHSQGTIRDQSKSRVSSALNTKTMKRSN